MHNRCDSGKPRKVQCRITLRRRRRHHHVANSGRRVAPPWPRRMACLQRLAGTDPVSWRMVCPASTRMTWSTSPVLTKRTTGCQADITFVFGGIPCETLTANLYTGLSIMITNAEVSTRTGLLYKLPHVMEFIKRRRLRHRVLDPPCDVSRAMWPNTDKHTLGLFANRQTSSFNEFHNMWQLIQQAGASAYFCVRDHNAESSVHREFAVNISHGMPPKTKVMSTFLRHMDTTRAQYRILVLILKELLVPARRS